LIVDVTLEIVAQIAFAVVALGILAWFEPTNLLLRPVAIGLIVACLATALVYAAQRRSIGYFKRFAQPVISSLLGQAFDRSDAVQSQVNVIYRARWRTKAGFLLHFGCWIGSSADIWLTLKFMGTPLDLASVIAIEGLLSGACGAAFFVPNAIGIQEGAYVALGVIFGLDPDSALALSILKRCRDLIIGLPALLFWQAVEARRLWTSRAARSPGDRRFIVRVPAFQRNASARSVRNRVAVANPLPPANDRRLARK
jgi:putative membrane protein